MVCLSSTVSFAAVAPSTAVREFRYVLSFRAQNFLHKLSCHGVGVKIFYMIVKSAFRFRHQIGFVFEVAFGVGTSSGTPSPFESEMPTISA